MRPPRCCFVLAVACAFVSSGASLWADVGGEPSTTQPTTAPTTKPARAPKGVMEHRRDQLDADTVRDGTFQHATYDADGTSIRLRDPRADFPFTGTWTSPTIETDFAFTELLPSWNVTVPDNTGVRFDVRVYRKATKTWSPWLYIGYWGRVLRDHRETDFDGGKVDTDTLTLDKPADAYEIRATLEDFHDRAPTTSPVIHRIDVVYSRPMPKDLKDRLESRQMIPSPPKPPIVRPTTMSLAASRSTHPGKTTTKPTTLPASIDIPVPFRAQGWEADAIRHSVCSPTSVSMVLEWAGHALPTDDNALAIWDDDNALFGNWNRAVQYAGSLGFSAHLERFSTMDEVRELLASGQPVIASIRFQKDTFPSNLQSATAGHLIVLRGYDEHGDIIVNDPASRDHGNGITYKADELANAWLVNTGGVGYVIEKK